MRLLRKQLAISTVILLLSVGLFAVGALKPLFGAKLSHVPSQTKLRDATQDCAVQQCVGISSSLLESVPTRSVVALGLPTGGPAPTLILFVASIVIGGELLKSKLKLSLFIVQKRQQYLCVWRD